MDALEQCGHPAGGGLVLAADDDAVWVEEVVDGGALAQEFGVRGNGDVVTTEGLLDDPRRAHRHRRLVHHDRLRRKHGRDGRRRLADVAEVGGPVGPLRGGHAEVAELAVLGRGRLPDDERQVPPIEPGADQLFEPGLPDRDLTAGQQVDTVRQDVGAHHLVAEMGEAGGRGEPHVPRPQHCNPTHEDINSFTRRSRGSW